MKKIGEIKGVPVVEGDANLVKNQILYKETDKGISLSKRTNGKLEEVSGGNNGGSSRVEYYKLLDMSMYEIVVRLCSLFKGINKETNKMTIASLGVVIDAADNNKDYFISVDALAFMPSGDNDVIIYSFKDLMYHILSQINPGFSEEEIESTFNAQFVPITEEEFYNLD